MVEADQISKVQQFFSLFATVGKPSQEGDCARCYSLLDNLHQRSPIIRFLVQHDTLLNSNGQATPITCVDCDEHTASGFNSQNGIRLCQNRLGSSKMMEDKLAHELIHAYDDKRFNLDWSNLRHQACTEIRANNLSGECGFFREWNRREIRLSNLNFTKQHQACVRRRAALSVSMNPACPNMQAAQAAVNEVWQSCWNDTRPFDEIY